jgi:hypothetical protein
MFAICQEALASSNAQAALVSSAFVAYSASFRMYLRSVIQSSEFRIVKMLPDPLVDELGDGRARPRYALKAAALPCSTTARP